MYLFLRAGFERSVKIKFIKFEPHFKTHSRGFKYNGTM